MAKMYQRKGWWYARATINRVEHRESLGTTNKTEARTRFETFVARVASARKSKWATNETPFTEAVTIFVERHLPNLKESSDARYIQSLAKLSPHFEGTTLQGISRRSLMDYVDAERKRGLADSTIRRDLGCLSSLFSVAARYELCEANPVSQFLKDMKRDRQLTEADYRTRYLKHAEELALLTQARAEADAAKEGSPRRHEKFMILCAFALYVDTGLRRKELLNAERSWLNMPGKEIVVPASSAKNGRERRVPLTDRALAIIAQIPEHKPESGEPSPYLLWRCKTGKRFMDLNKTLQRVAARAGIQDITIHDLRRTCGCRLLQDLKLPMEQVSNWLGHGSIDITAKRYAFLKVGDLQEALGRKRNPDLMLQVASFFDVPGERSLLGTQPQTMLENKG